MTKLTESDIAHLHPETLALSYGFDPWLSEGAVKPPVLKSVSATASCKTQSALSTRSRT